MVAALPRVRVNRSGVATLVGRPTMGRCLMAMMVGAP
jgi:hypothetical protein